MNGNNENDEEMTLKYGEYTSNTGGTTPNPHTIQIAPQPQWQPTVETNFQTCHQEGLIDGIARIDLSLGLNSEVAKMKRNSPNNKELDLKGLNLAAMDQNLGQFRRQSAPLITPPSEPIVNYLSHTVHSSVERQFSDQTRVPLLTFASSTESVNVMKTPLKCASRSKSRHRTNRHNPLAEVRSETARAARIVKETTELVEPDQWMKVSQDCNDFEENYS